MRGKTVTDSRISYYLLNRDDLVLYIPVSKGKTYFGVKYRFELPLTGPNEKTKPIIVVFQIDNDKSTPRLVTNYVKKKGHK